VTIVVSPADVERFREIVSRRFGLSVDATKIGALADVLRRRSEPSARTCSAFLGRLETGEAKDELAAIAAELTVPETYFFRHMDQFRAFTGVVLPDRLRARANVRELRILSAGCATGEEAYTLAILIREAGLDPSWDVSIRGQDVNPAVLAKASRGRFSAWALRETPADVRRRWFRRDAAEFALAEEIKNAVVFEEKNLGDPDLWQPETYDVVFWRNVMMYFTPDFARAVVDRVTRALVPGGYLFLGHAETLRGISNDFHLRHTHDAFYYQRKQVTDAADRDEPVALSDPWPAAAPLADVVDGADSWVDAIQKASRRIHALTDGARSSSPLSSIEPAESRRATTAARPPAWNLALELLEKERFADALELVRALPPESARDPNVMLLRAVLLTHGGELLRAEEACNELLAVDELDAGAHYLLALCREGAGDRRAAVDHDQVAVYLDPGFAMPRLHLGLLARRADDREGARRDLADALVLLQREDASRLLLFGGGFGRGALIALCRAELLACGGRA
jgi:chemotaxis protein methyltransferase CheR